MRDRKPRRKPKRRSSVEIVQAILDAAEELFVRDGIDQTTTNHIADRAGVGIASLYRYYPNKDAVVAAVVARLNERLAEAVEKVIGCTDLKPRERVVASVDAFLDPTTLPLRRALRGVIPPGWEEGGLDDAERHVARLIGDLAPQLTQLSPDQARERLFMLMSAIRGVVRGALRHDLSLIEAGRVRAFVLRLVERELSP